MNFDAIDRLQRKDFNFDMPGAAMVLAWKRLADERWSKRDFSKITRREFGEQLVIASKTVSEARLLRKKQKIADTLPRVIELRECLNSLSYAPFGINIGPRQDRILEEIADIVNSIEV